MKVNINGKEYPSIKSMCKDLKIGRPTVYKHMREKNARYKMMYIICEFRDGRLRKTIKKIDKKSSVIIQKSMDIWYNKINNEVDKMSRYIQGKSRNQISMITTSLDEMIQEDNPVRVIDALVESLNMKP